MAKKKKKGGGGGSGFEAWMKRVGKRWSDKAKYKRDAAVAKAGFDPIDRPKKGGSRPSPAGTGGGGLSDTEMLAIGLGVAGLAFALSRGGDK